jgi:hypothetical protein
VRPFLVCVHDATPAYEPETREMIRQLGPLVGRRLSFAVVPDWHGRWPLAEHPGYCRLVRESSDELLLHGYFHRRGRGWGPLTFLVEGTDEMSGLDPRETRRTLERGQEVFAGVFGEAARGFLAPAWQRGHVRAASSLGLDHVLGFWSLESRTGRKIPLATWSWHCGRWGWLGHVGHGVGWALHSLGSRVPALAIHPRDLDRSFWPRILGLVRALLDAGYEPTTVRELIGAEAC